MKKGSTAAVKRSKNIPQQKLTIGLDLVDRNRWMRRVAVTVVVFGQCMLMPRPVALSINLCD